MGSRDTVEIMYLYCVCSQAVPQREDAVVFNDLYETVDHSAEMDVHPAQVRKTNTLRLRTDGKWK